MVRFAAIAIAAWSLVGCAAAPQTGMSANTVTAKPVHCEAPTGSHIADPSDCGHDAFLKRGVITDRSGNPYEATGNPGH